MIRIGQLNTLKVIKEVDFGLYLDGEDWGDILLPRKYVPKGCKINDKIEVFIYFDSHDRIIATTQTPLATLSSLAFLKVIDINPVGVYLDWGLDKDLLVPGPEQQRPMQLGKFYIVYLKLDHKDRIIASSKLDHFLDKSPSNFKEGEAVDLLIAEKTHLGNKVIINDRHWGLIHNSEIFQTLRYGARMRGYIKTKRLDGKIDVVLRQTGPANFHDLAKCIVEELNNQGGFLALHDKSSPGEIKNAFGESKSNFKNAIGLLYKQGVIRIESDGIYLK